MNWESLLTSGFIGILLTLIVEVIKYYTDRGDKKKEKKDNFEEKLEDIANDVKEINSKVTEQGIAIENLKKQTNDQDKQLDKIEKDSVRNQLMTMMSDYSNRVDEIMEIAEHYFKDLKGNWYVTNIFKTWLVNHEEVGMPDWFIKK